MRRVCYDLRAHFGSIKSGETWEAKVIWGFNLMKPHETFVYGLQILFGKLWDETSKKQFFYYNNDTLRYCSKDWNITWYRYLCLIPILCGFTHISRRWWLIIEQLLVCHRRWIDVDQIQVKVNFVGICVSYMTQLWDASSIQLMRWV